MLVDSAAMIASTGAPAQGAVAQYLANAFASALDGLSPDEIGIVLGQVINVASQRWRKHDDACGQVIMASAAASLGKKAPSAMIEIMLFTLAAARDHDAASFERLAKRITDAINRIRDGEITEFLSPFLGG